MEVLLVPVGGTDKNRNGIFKVAVNLKHTKLHYGDSDYFYKPTLLNIPIFLTGTNEGATDWVTSSIGSEKFHK